MKNLEEIICELGCDVHKTSIITGNPSDEITVLQPQTVEYMKQLLYEVVTKGTGKRAYTPNVLGGKTGTSNDNRDAWFIGATPDYVMGVWVGRDDNTSMSSKITGGTLPATIFHKIVE